MIWLPASMTMYSYWRASSRKTSSRPADVRGARALELIGAGQDVEPGLVLDDQLAQELAVEAVEVVDGVEQRVAAAHAEEQRDLAEAGLQVDDDRRPLAQPRELDAAVHRQRRRSRSRPWRRRRPSSSPGRDAADDWRRAAVRAIASENADSTGGQVKNSLAPARIACRMSSGSGSVGDDEDRHGRRGGAHALDRAPSPRRHRRRASTMTRSAGAPSRASRSPLRLTGVGAGAQQAQPSAS